MTTSSPVEISNLKKTNKIVDIESCARKNKLYDWKTKQIYFRKVKDKKATIPKIKNAQPIVEKILLVTMTIRTVSNKGRDQTIK